MSALNFFRGIHHGLAFGLNDRRLTTQWCRNILRMVAPHLWLCPDLMAPLDRTALVRVAMVSEIGGSTKLEKRPDCAMDDFELAPPADPPDRKHPPDDPATVIASAFSRSIKRFHRVVATAGASPFRFLLPSSLDPRSSLTVWGASTSLTTLFIMLVATPVSLP